jgi:hypothetical protein
MNLLVNAPSAFRKASGFEVTLKAIRVRHKSLANPNCSHHLIDGEANELPMVLWSQDFEVRMSLKVDDRESTRKFMKPRMNSAGS